MLIDVPRQALPPCPGAGWLGFVGPYPSTHPDENRFPKEPARSLGERREDVKGGFGPYDRGMVQG